MGSSAAATCVPAWVSTPPVMRRDSTMVMPSLFLWLKGWHAPAGRRTWDPRPLAQDGQIRPARRQVPQKPGPGRRIVSRTTPEGGVSRFGGQAGPRLPALRPHHRKTAQAGPEAQSPSSLPTRRGVAAVPNAERVACRLSCSARSRYSCRPGARVAVTWLRPGGRGGPDGAAGAVGRDVDAAAGALIRMRGLPWLRARSWPGWVWRRPERLGGRCLPVRRGLSPAGAGRRARRGRGGGSRAGHGPGS